MDKKITVLMAVHQYDKFLDEAIRSIINQSFEDFEFIIVANAASENFLEILKKFGELDSRILIVSIPLPGLANALNFGISIAKAPFIARMDADDISHSNRLALQYSYMLNNPQVAIVGCKSDLINSNNEVIGVFSYYPDDKSIRKVLPYRNPLLHPAIMIRKAAILKVGGYRYGHMSEDHELFIRMARDTALHFFNLDAVLFKYRRHDNQITSSRNAFKNYAEITGFLVTEFILTKNPLYLVGSLAVHPFIRRIRNYLKLFSVISWPSKK